MFMITFICIRGMAAVSLAGWKRPVTPETMRSSSRRSWHKVRLDVKSRGGSVLSLRLCFGVGLFMPYGPMGGGRLKKNLDVLPVFQELFWLVFFNCLTCLDHVWYFIMSGVWAMACKIGTALFWDSKVVFYSFHVSTRQVSHHPSTSNLHHHDR